MFVILPYSSSSPTLAHCCFAGAIIVLHHLVFLFIRGPARVFDFVAGLPMVVIHGVLLLVTDSGLSPVRQLWL